MKKYLFLALVAMNPLAASAGTCYLTADFFCPSVDAQHKFHAFAKGTVVGEGSDCSDWNELRRADSFINYLNANYADKLLPNCNHRNKITRYEVRVIVWGPENVAQRDHALLVEGCEQSSYDQGCEVLDKAFEMGSWE
ncbi:MAG: hypothetical protein JKY99_04615 [Rhizobiales bacterium]|nr:hypothetical protein [Hyphomicrobiales bacterium]